MLQDFHLENYKMTDVEARVALDRELMNSNVEDILWNNAFEAAFRDKYGNSPISTFSGASTESITKFLNAAFNRSGHLVVGDGIDQLELSETVKGAFGRKITAASDTSPVFYGGERRVELDGDMNHVLVGFGTSGMANLEESLAMRILKNLVSSAGSLQYGSIRTHLPGLQALLAKEMLPITIKASNVSYSQGGLMGIHLSAPQSVGLRDVLETLCSDLKEFANGGVSPDVLGAAKTRAAFELVNSVESRFGRASYITQSILSSGKLPNLSEELKALHSMSSSEFKSFASKILLRRSVFVSAGNLRSLPYADELAF